MDIKEIWCKNVKWINMEFDSRKEQESFSSAQRPECFWSPLSPLSSGYWRGGGGIVARSGI
jgi:hypothetical protein